MTVRIHAISAGSRISRRSGCAFLIAAFLTLASLQGCVQAPVSPKPPAFVNSASPPAPVSAMDRLIGPIALYPDDLIAIILPASTNPLQIVQGERFLANRVNDPRLSVNENWDDAVKALLNYPDIVRKMSTDLDWTISLGEAVVSDQGAVLEAIQVFRRRAWAAGHLNSDEKQVVRVEQEIVNIVPADPQVIFVPEYVPSTMMIAGVAPVYGYYPTAYPSYYYPYPPGTALAAGIVWGAAIGAAWNGGWYSAHYGGDANITVNHNGNVNRDRSGAIKERPGNAGTAWKSNKQPGQVSSSLGKSATSTRVGDAHAGGTGGVNRGAYSGAGGNRSAGPAGAPGGGAFSGYGSGRQTQMNSARGASSRGSMSGGGGFSGARGGGGFGGGRGGGRR